MACVRVPNDVPGLVVSADRWPNAKSISAKRHGACGEESGSVIFSLCEIILGQASLKAPAYWENQGLVVHAVRTFSLQRSFPDPLQSIKVWEPRIDTNPQVAALEVEVNPGPGALPRKGNQSNFRPAPAKFRGLSPPDREPVLLHGKPLQHDRVVQAS